MKQGEDSLDKEAERLYEKSKDLPEELKTIVRINCRAVNPSLGDSE